MDYRFWKHLGQSYHYYITKNDITLEFYAVNSNYINCYLLASKTAAYDFRSLYNNKTLLWAYQDWFNKFIK